MKIFNKFYKCKFLQLKFPKINKRFFTTSLSFKNKINSFFKYVHPDVLGKNAPDEYRKNNEKSIQEFNSYLDNLNQPIFFEKKTLNFFIKLEKKIDKEKIQDYFEKISIDLENIKQDISNSNKFAIQSNLGLKIEDLVKKINKLKALNTKEIITQKDYEDYQSEELKFKNDKPKIYKHNEFIEEVENLQSTIVAIQNKTLTDYEKKKLELIKKIDRAINNKTDFFQNRRSPDIKARFLVESLSNIKEIEKNLLNAYPLTHIYLDSKITEEQKKIFLNKFYLKDFSVAEKFIEMQKLNTLSDELLGNNNTVRLLISDKYDINEMPGYLTIPYNFEIDELLRYLFQNKLEIYRLKEKFLEENETMNNLRFELKKWMKIKEINFIHKGDKNMKEIMKLEQQLMGLKRIKKIFMENFMEITKNKNSSSEKYKALYNFEKIHISFYKLKTEVLLEKNGTLKINISHPLNENFLVRQIKNKIELYSKKEIDLKESNLD